MKIGNKALIVVIAVIGLYAAFSLLRILTLFLVKY